APAAEAAGPTKAAAQAGGRAARLRRAERRDGGKGEPRVSGQEDDGSQPQAGTVAERRRSPAIRAAARRPGETGRIAAAAGDEAVSRGSAAGRALPHARGGRRGAPGRESRAEARPSAGAARQGSAWRSPADGRHAAAISIRACGHPIADRRRQRGYEIFYYSVRDDSLAFSPP